MGLLTKTNPEATTASVICWALGGALFAPIGLLLLRIPLPTYLMVAVAFLGAGIGALVEWQLDDGIDPKEDVSLEATPVDGLWDREIDQSESLIRTRIR